MVALKYNLPLIHNDQGIAVAFESEWLKAALDQAARKAGYDGWWLSDEFSTAIAQYLRHDYDESVIELPILERVIRTALRDIGYQEIAARFRAVNPCQCLSLAECLQTSHGKQEPAFFQRLAERIDGLHAAKVRHFHFYDLQACVHRLLGNKAAACGPQLRARIVEFVRERVRTLSWQSQMHCTIR